MQTKKQTTCPFVPFDPYCLEAATKLNGLLYRKGNYLANTFQCLNLKAIISSFIKYKCPYKDGLKFIPRIGFPFLHLLQKILSYKLTLKMLRTPGLAIFCNPARLPVLELKHEPRNKTFNLQSRQSSRCAQEIEARSLWEWPTNDWPNFSPMPPEIVHALHCLNGQDPEARQCRDQDRKKVNKIVPKIFCYTHRLLHNLNVIREVFSSNLWEHIQK